MGRRGEVLAGVAPTRASARSAVVHLAGRAKGPIDPFSLAEYLASPHAAGRIVLCPAGRSLTSDIGFLREVSERALWAPTDPILAGAIEGLLGFPPPAAPDRFRDGRALLADRKTGPTATALLLEGTVTSARARALAAGDARHWIVESPRRVRVERRLMKRLRRLGVRWSALEPVTVAGVLASPLLAAARSRWKPLLPAGTPVWVRGRL